VSNDPFDSPPRRGRHDNGVRILERSIKTSGNSNAPTPAVDTTGATFLFEPEIPASKASASTEQALRKQLANAKYNVVSDSRLRYDVELVARVDRPNARDRAQVTLTAVVRNQIVAKVQDDVTVGGPSVESGELPDVTQLVTLLSHSEKLQAAGERIRQEKAALARASQH